MIGGPALDASTGHALADRRPRDTATAASPRMKCGRRRGGIEPLHVSMPRELKSRPSTSPTHPGIMCQLGAGFAIYGRGPAGGACETTRNMRQGANGGIGARCSIWPRGVTVSTLDSESSDRGSNPREALPSICDGHHADRASRVRSHHREQNRSEGNAGLRGRQKMSNSKLKAKVVPRQSLQPQASTKQEPEGKVARRLEENGRRARGGLRGGRGT